MEPGVIIIGVISLVACILPFVLMNSNRKKIEQQHLQSLAGVAALYQCNVTEYEFCAGAVIGLDAQNGYVFFYRRIHDKELAQGVRLSGIQTCKMVKSGRNLAEYPTIDTIELRFISAVKTDPDVVLELFNIRDSLQLAGELSWAERWEKKINALLAQRNAA